MTISKRGFQVCRRIWEWISNYILTSTETKQIKMKTSTNPEGRQNNYTQNTLHDLAVNNIYMVILIETPSSDFNQNLGGSHSEKWGRVIYVFDEKEMGIRES